MKKILLVLLIFCIVTLSPSFAVEVAPPNPQIESAAAQALMNTVAQLSKSTVSLSEKNDKLRTVALSLAKLGRSDRALEVVQLISKNTDSDISQTRHRILLLAIHHSAANGKFQNAATLVAQITDASTKEHALWLLTKAYIQQGDLEDAAKLLERIKSPKAKAGALLMLAQAYVKKHDNAAAQKVLFQITALAPHDFHFLTRAAFLHALSGNVTIARQLFDKAEKNWNQYDGETDQPVKSQNSRLQHHTFGRCLLQAGFVEILQRSSPHLCLGKTRRHRATGI